jgi:hypothetical protein
MALEAAMAAPAGAAVAGSVVGKEAVVKAEAGSVAAADSFRPACMALEAATAVADSEAVAVADSATAAAAAAR